MSTPTAATPTPTPPGPRRRGAAVAAGLAAALLALAPACSDDGDDGETGAPADPPPGAADPADAVDARLEVDVERLDAGLDITWSVTNDGDEPLLVVDGLRGDEAAGEPVHGAYVTGGDGSGRGGGDGVAEISRRVFPVAGGAGDQAAEVTGAELAPGGTQTVTDNVALPLEAAPAAPDGGGDDLPGDPRQAVFCVGVAPAGALDAVPLAAVPGRVAVPHGEAGDAAQTLLCSDPFDL